jgi:hypothetical protein
MNRHAFSTFALLASFATFNVATPLAAAGPGRPTDPPCDGLSTYMATLPVEPLSDVEKEGLLFTREEEKLARDVYAALAAKWGQRAFTAIAAAEQQHMDTVAFLLSRYALADPAAGKAPGVFSNARLQALYVSLLEKGSVSLVEAFAVGATIEDLDLADVEKLLADADSIDLDTVMQNLAKGSRNHLRSFVALLTASGVTYVPQFLSPEEYAGIISTPAERHVVYDAAGFPVEGIPAGPCDGLGAVAGQGSKGPAAGQGSSKGPGAGSGSGSCDGTGAGSPGGTGNPGSGAANGGGH